MVHYSLFDTAIGPCGIAWRDDIVVATRLPDETAEATARQMADQNGATPEDPPKPIERAISKIVDLFATGTGDLTDIACDFSGLDPFAVRVLEATRKVQPGQTTTYGAIAEGLGDIGLSRKVGQALGKNPFPIIVPCHRIIGAGDKMTGFSAAGGITLKLRMLDIEGAQIGAVGGLFDDLPLAIKPAP